MQVFTPYVDPGNALIGAIKKLLSKRRGRGKLLKMLVRLWPQFNRSSLVFKDIHLPLDLRNDTEIGLFYDGCIKHEVFYQKVITELINSDSVFFDVGCNVGYYTFLVAPYVRKVFAFEANPALAKRVQNIMKTSGMKNSACFNIGLSNVTGVQSFYFNNSSHDLGSFIKPDYPHVSSDVFVRTLDDVISELALMKPTIVKIDVEGLELEILEGFKQMSQPKPIMFLEWNYSEDVAADKFMRLKNIISSEYVVFAISRHEKLIAVDHGFIKPHDASDLLLIPDSQARYSLIAQWIAD